MSVKVTFKFDDDGFRKIAQQAVDDAARDLQRLLDRVQRRSSGKPVDEVLRHLRSAVRSSDFNFTDSELRGYAEAIAEGRSIKVKPDKIKR